MPNEPIPIRNTREIHEQDLYFKYSGVLNCLNHHNIKVKFLHFSQNIPKHPLLLDENDLKEKEINKFKFKHPSN